MERRLRGVSPPRGASSFTKWAPADRKASPAAKRGRTASSRQRRSSRPERGTRFWPASPRGWRSGWRSTRPSSAARRRRRSSSRASGARRPCPTPRNSTPSLGRRRHFLSSEAANAMHIPPFDNENRPIVDVDDPRVPLVYFNVVKLKRGETFHSLVEGYETAIVPATGVLDVDVSGARFDDVGRRGADV